MSRKFEFEWTGAKVDLFELEYQFANFLLQNAMADSEGIKARAAELLSCHRTTVVMKLKALEGRNAVPEELPPQGP